MSHSIVFGNIERRCKEGLMSKDNLNDDINYNVQWACRYGSLELLKYLHINYNLTKKDFQIYNLRHACVWEHYEILFFLSTTYGFTI
jgi:hypothetical protein